MKITVLHPEGDPTQDIYPKVLKECLPLEILNKVDIFKNERGEWTIEVNTPLTIKYRDKLLITSQTADDIIKQELGGITVGNTDKAMTLNVDSLDDLIVNIDDLKKYRILTTEDLKNVLTNPAPGQTTIKLYVDGYDFSGALQYGDGDNLIGVDAVTATFGDYALDAETMAKWDKIIAVRDAVNVELEAARAEKKIGKALEAAVELTVPAEDAFLSELSAQELSDLLIVSQVELTVGEELKISVSNAAGVKCPRCWKHSHSQHPDGLCPRCAAVVAKLPQE